MRLSLIFALLVTVSLTAFAVVRAEDTRGPGPTAPQTPVSSSPDSAPPATASPPPNLVQSSAAASAPKPAVAACANPNALGIARTVEIDTTGGPGFGFQHFRQLDFLRDKEVVLTFDDGPWVSTPAVLKALADECVKAIFFAIGLHTTYYPEILRKVAEAGHTIGAHTWSHKDLTKKPYDTDPEKAKEEIEKGFSAVKMALGTSGAPFFRFPALKHPPDLVTYLGTRDIAIFSTDIDSFDFKMHRPEQVIKSVMTKLAKQGKGIVLMHDFHQNTANALPELLKELKENGYKIVFMRPKDQVKTLPQYDEEVIKDQKLPTVSTRPTSSVVHDVN
jgi:peptidoglycan/xylan/chitin deacetylase (PgdA/CDA1 family)